MFVCFKSGTYNIGYDSVLPIMKWYPTFTRDKGRTWGLHCWRFHFGWMSPEIWRMITSTLLADYLVYELVDASGDEMYYPLGMYRSIGAALYDIEEHRKIQDDKCPPISHCEIDSDIILEIRAWKYGLNEAEKVWSEKYNREYIEDHDEYEWRSTKESEEEKARVKPTEDAGCTD